MNVKVGHTDYHVEESALELEEGRCGVTFKQLSLIKIRPHLSPGVYKETLLHEVLHACANFAGVGNTEELNEEEWVTRLSPVLLMVLQDNTDLLEALELYDA